MLRRPVELPGKWWPPLPKSGNGQPVANPYVLKLQNDGYLVWWEERWPNHVHEAHLICVHLGSCYSWRWLHRIPPPTLNTSSVLLKGLWRPFTKYAVPCPLWAAGCSIWEPPFHTGREWTQGEKGEAVSRALSSLFKPWFIPPNDAVSRWSMYILWIGMGSFCWQWHFPLLHLPLLKHLKQCLVQGKHYVIVSYSSPRCWCSFAQQGCGSCSVLMSIRFGLRHTCIWVPALPL